MTSPLVRMLEDRSQGRFLQLYAQLASSLPNAYCQLESIDGRECVINGKRLVNFNAINYLGLENHPRLIHAAQQRCPLGHAGRLGRAAAETRPVRGLEDRIAGWLGVDNVIVYTTVTLANHGVIPLLMRKGSLLLMDQEVHNSVQRSGVEARGAGATVLTFPHDNFELLEAQLREHRPQHDHVLIALDGIYSMSGTYLNLPRYQELAQKYGATLYIDDAHGFGVVGPEGRGIVSHYGASYENTIYVPRWKKAWQAWADSWSCPRNFAITSASTPIPTPTPASCLRPTWPARSPRSTCSKRKARSGCISCGGISRTASRNSLRWTSRSSARTSRFR